MHELKFNDTVFLVHGIDLHISIALYAMRDGFWKHWDGAAALPARFSHWPNLPQLGIRRSPDHPDIFQLKCMSTGIPVLRAISQKLATNAQHVGTRRDLNGLYGPQWHLSVYSEYMRSLEFVSA